LERDSLRHVLAFDCTIKLVKSDQRSSKVSQIWSKGQRLVKGEGFNYKYSYLMSAYFCPHSVFNSGYLIEFVCLKSELIDNYDN